MALRETSPDQNLPQDSQSLQNHQDILSEEQDNWKRKAGSVRGVHRAWQLGQRSYYNLFWTFLPIKMNNQPPRLISLLLCPLGGPSLFPLSSSCPSVAFGVSVSFSFFQCSQGNKKCRTVWALSQLSMSPLLWGSGWNESNKVMKYLYFGGSTLSVCPLFGFFVPLFSFSCSSYSLHSVSLLMLCFDLLLLPTSLLVNQHRF